MYERIILNALRYFGMRDFVAIDRMTFREYRLRIQASNLRQMDKEYLVYLHAWQNREVNAKKKSGKKLKYIFTSFKDFFDMDKRENPDRGVPTSQKTGMERRWLCGLACS